MTPATSDEQTQFASILSAIEARLDHGFVCDPELKEELIATAIGHSFLLFLRASRRTKKVTPGTLAFYAARMTRAGRQVDSRWTRYDALASNTGEIQHPLSLSGDKLGELLEDRKNSWPTVPHRVGIGMDWSGFMSGQSKRSQDITGLCSGNEH